MRDATPDVHGRRWLPLGLAGQLENALSRRHRPLPFSSHAQADTTTNGPQPIIRPAATNDSVSPPKRVQ